MSSSKRKDSSERVEVARYIPLPDALYALRSRFPSVLESVLLECTHCRKWVAVEVLSAIPDETPTAPASSTAAARVQVGLGNKRCNHLNAEQQSAQQAPSSRDESDGASGWQSRRIREMQARLLCSSTVTCSSTEQGEEVASDLAPERQLLAKLLLGDSSSELSSGKRRGPPRRAEMFIQNPATFVCGWLDCQRMDLMMDLRVSWLSQLHAALVNKGGSSSGSSNNTKKKHTTVTSFPGTSASEHFTPQELHAELLRHRATLNDALSSELGMRRSGRLAGKGSGSSSSSTSNGYATSQEQDGDAEVPEAEGKRRVVGRDATATQAWARQTAQHILHRADEETLLSAFCWAMCERCGKIRRVAQPFPGGGPFVCALSASVGSCNVSETDAIARYTCEYTAAELTACALAMPRLPYPAQQEYTRSLQHPSRSSNNGEEAFSLVDEPLYHAVRSELSHYPSTCHSGVRECLPVLKELVACLKRHKVMKSFAQQVMLTPAAIRRKREEVLRDLESAENTAAAELQGKKMGAVKAEGSFKEEAEAVVVTAESNVTHIDENEEHQTTLSRSFERSTRRRASAPHTEPALSMSGVKRGRSATKSATEAEEKDDAAVVKDREGSIADKEKKPTRTPRRGSTSGTLVHSDAAAPLPSSSSRSKREAAVASNVIFAAAPFSVVDVDASQSSDVAACAPPPVTLTPRQRGKRPKMDVETIHWVQCDMCSKWRIVPKPIPRSTKTWDCSKRNDGTTCEDTDDEERMNAES